MKKTFIKLINYDLIDIFNQKGYWFKIRIEFLWPILAKIELICQQPQVSGAHPSSEVPQRMTGGLWGGLAVISIVEMMPDAGSNKSADHLGSTWPRLTHWGRVTHICVSKLTITGSDNGLSPDRRQAIIWTNAGLLLIGPLGTNFSEILIEILTFLFKKMRLKVSSAKRRPFCLGLNVLIFNKTSYLKISRCLEARLIS